MTQSNMPWLLENTYQALPSTLYHKTSPSTFKEPHVLLYNTQLGKTLGIPKLHANQIADYFSGKTLIEGSDPIAQAYAGHQFAYFNNLGDGRALLLGEQVTPDLRRFDIQLKGSGPTAYSRRGDGKATLKSMLREYIISEAMFALGIPTTRSLAVVTTGEKIQREELERGAVLTRISLGHIRVGTFQYAATRPATVQALADYSINRFFPNLAQDKNRYINFLDEVVKRQAKLIAKWQLVGFIHGVMNTDNMSIVGETIDYGPCAFMDTYHHKKVFSSIDTYGRYAYHNQPFIGNWNLARFAESILSLLHQDEKKAIEIAETSLSKYAEIFELAWLEGMGKKLGFKTVTAEHKSHFDSLLQLMESHQLDYTNTFVYLANEAYDSGIPQMNEWIQKWHLALKSQHNNWTSVQDLMHQNNPYIIPRNHQVAHALNAAEHNQMEPLHNLLEALKNPFDNTTKNHKYTLPPEKNEIVHKTFCGT